MADEKELKVIALHCALELAKGKDKSITAVVKDAKEIHEFLNPEKDNKPLS